MSDSWPSAARSTKPAQPPNQHVCIGGLAISTCPKCAGHPQGYRNPICQQCKGCGVVTETCRQCLLSNSVTSSANTSQMTSPATSCGTDCTTFEQRMAGYSSRLSGTTVIDEEDEPENHRPRKKDADDKESS